jgi:DDE superfamily endonuclease
VTGSIIEIGGPAPGHTHDLTLAYSSSSITNLSLDEHLLADLGYVGHPQILTPAKRRRHEDLSEEDQETNQKIAKICIKVEHIIGDIKAFQALAQPWRHDKAKHLLPSLWLLIL